MFTFPLCICYNWFKIMRFQQEEISLLCTTRSGVPNNFKQIFHTVLLVTFGLLTIALLTMYLLMNHLTLSYLDSVMSRFVETAYSSIEDQILTKSEKMRCRLPHPMTEFSLFFLPTPSSLSDQLKSVRSIDLLCQPRFFPSIRFSSIIMPPIKFICLERKFAPQI